MHVTRWTKKGPAQTAHAVLMHMGMLGDSFYAIKGRLETLCAGL